MRIRRHLTYANVMSTIAVIIAVAGGSTAVAVTVNASKKSDINKKGNIRAARVTTPKLANGAVTAAKLAGIDVVQATAPGTAIASCQSGERLLGGGALIQSNNPPGVALQASQPVGNTWKAFTSGGSPDLTAYALCLKSTSGP
jgi:hypothetical protein